MKEAPGWYVDPDDDTQERYFNGSMWQQQTRRRRDSTPYSGAGSVEAQGTDRDSTAYTNELLEAVLIETRRSANYLAIITYITVVLLVLGIAGVIVGFVATR